MNHTAQCNALQSAAYKTVQRKSRNAPIPGNAVHAAILKTLETELQKRGLLKAPAPGTFHPFWFLVETERNVFLWRRGCSIIQQDEFEFWVDIEGLCKKRIRQLELADPDNPFVNTNWGTLEETNHELFQLSSQQETEYLESLMQLINKIVPHLNALCEVGSILERERNNGDREKVLLPVARTKVPA